MAGNSLLLQVTEWDIFTRSIYYLNSYLTGCSVFYLQNLALPAESPCLLRDAQCFHVCFEWPLQLQACPRREVVASHHAVALGAGAGARLVIS